MCGRASLVFSQLREAAGHEIVALRMRVRAVAYVRSLVPTVELPKHGKFSCPAKYWDLVTGLV